MRRALFTAALVLAAPLTLFLIVRFMEGAGVPNGAELLDRWRLEGAPAAFDGRAQLSAPAPGPGRFVREIETGRRDAALLIFGVERSLNVSLDGAPLPIGGEAGAPSKHKPFNPLFIPLPAASGALSFIIASEGGPPGFYRAYLGARSEISRAYRIRRFFGVDLVTAATGVASFAGVLALATALVGAERALVGAFGGLMMIWATRNYMLVGGSAGLTDAAAERLSAGLSMALLVAGFAYIAIWANVPARRAVLAIGAFGVLLTCLAGLDEEIARLALLCAASFALLGMTALLARRCLAAQAPPWAEAYCLTIGLWAGALDILTAAGLDSHAFPGTGLSLPYSALGAMPVAWAMILHLARRASDERRALASRNAVLSAELKVREAEIARAYADRAAAMREAALTEERQRIMRDMHDGFSGHLFGLAAELRRPDAPAPETVAADILKVIDEIRLMVDSLDTAGDDLAIALGAFRARIQPKIEAAGLKLDWWVDPVAAKAALDAGAVLDIFRILQEACANAMRHAAAKRLSIRVEGDGADLSLVVQDDGKGLPRSQQGGQGLKNMRLRAQRLGAKLDIQDAQPGCRIALSLKARRAP